MRIKLIEARKNKNMSQRELGEMIGLRQPNICHLERGRIEGKAKTWDALESVLGVDQKELRQRAAH